MRRALVTVAATVLVLSGCTGDDDGKADVLTYDGGPPPSSVEAYYQEVGRAGRDGEPAYGLLLTSSTDMPLRRRLTEGGGDGERVDSAVIEHKWGLFLELMRWVEAGGTMDSAIAREKQLKRYRREWKRNLIERENPAWNDLAVGLGLEPLAAVSGGAVDPGTRPG